MKPTETQTAVKEVESQTEIEKSKDEKRPCHVPGELKKILSKYYGPFQKEALLDLVVSMTKYHFEGAEGERDCLMELLEEEMIDWLNNKWCDFAIEDKWELLQKIKLDPRYHIEDAEVIEDRDTEANVVENEDGTEFPSTGVAKLDEAIGGLAYDEIAIAHVVWELSQIDHDLGEKIGNALRTLLKPLIETERGWEKMPGLRNNPDVVIRVQWWLRFL